MTSLGQLGTINLSSRDVFRKIEILGLSLPVQIWIGGRSSFKFAQINQDVDLI